MEERKRKWTGEQYEKCKVDQMNEKEQKSITEKKDREEREICAKWKLL